VSYRRIPLDQREGAAHVAEVDAVADEPLGVEPTLAHPFDHPREHRAVQAGGVQRQLLAGELLLGDRRRVRREAQHSVARRRRRDADSLLQDPGVAHRIEDQCGTRLEPQPAERFGQRLARGVDRLVGPTGAGQVQPLVDAIGDENTHPVYPLQDLEHHETDRPRAVDESDVARKHPRAARDVRGHREGLDGRRGVLRDPRGNGVGVRRRRAEVLGEAAVAVDPQHLHSVAHVGPSDRAGVASAAADHGVHGDELAHASHVDALGHRVDAPHELVPDHARVDHERVLAVEDVHVGAADAGVAHAHAHLAGRGLGGRAFHDRDTMGLLHEDAPHGAGMISPDEGRATGPLPFERPTSSR